MQWVSSYFCIVGEKHKTFNCNIAAHARKNIAEYEVSEVSVKCRTSADCLCYCSHIPTVEEMLLTTLDYIFLLHRLWTVSTSVKISVINVNTQQAKIKPCYIKPL